MLTRAFKHQSAKIKDLIFRADDKVLERRMRIANNRIDDIIATNTLLNHGEWSDRVNINQYGIIKRYHSSQIIPSSEQQPVLYNGISEREKDGKHKTVYKDSDNTIDIKEPAQYSLDSKSYGG